MEWVGRNISNVNKYIFKYEVIKLPVDDILSTENNTYCKYVNIVILKEIFNLCIYFVKIFLN